MNMDKLAEINDTDLDFCYECNTDTRWDGEQCTGCGRIWGYALGEDPKAWAVA